MSIYEPGMIYLCAKQKEEKIFKDLFDNLTGSLKELFQKNQELYTKIQEKLKPKDKSSFDKLALYQVLEMLCPDKTSSRYYNAGRVLLGTFEEPKKRAASKKKQKKSPKKKS